MYEDRNSTIDVLNRLDIPKVLVGRATNLDPRRITDFVKGRPVPESDAARIKEAVQKIHFIWDIFAPYKIFFDTPELMESAYATAKVQKAFSQVGAEPKKEVSVA